MQPRMALEKDQIRKVAKLARLRLTDEEEDIFFSDLNKIFDWMDHMSRIDVSQTQPPTSILPEEVALRADKAGRGEKVAILSNAQGSAVEGFFAVPKVIGEE